jgi:cysteinyl-tRNA synthetase
MQIHNTKTRKKELFKPLGDREVKVYFCGPTVYSHAHIGNLRTYIFEDIVVKTLKFLWYNVKTTMNITDVDDKTIRDSMKAGESLGKFTEKYTKLFLDDIEKLGIEKADNIIKVTDLIPEMVRMINTLLRRWFAYISEDNSIYYKVSKFKKYGELANLDMKWLKANARVDNDEYDKDSVSDFVLWKSWKEGDGENFWEEEFEAWEEKRVIKWRPGWHIECSACSMKSFWPQIDIHMWWEDLIFPHHQNEIAQSEACTRKEFSKYWLHSGHLMVDGKKMSKSLWNFHTLKDLEEKFVDTNKSVLHRAVRLSFINGKFRESIDFSFDKLEANFNTINNIDSAIKNIYSYDSEDIGIARDFRESMQNFIWNYMYYLEDDFNIVEALVVFHELVKFVNIGIREKSFSSEEKQSILDMLETFNQVLWILDFSILAEDVIPVEVLAKLEARNKAKKEKDFSGADNLRKQIEEMWYKVVDEREGSRVESY